jgi:hypothetical protein
MSLEKLNEVRKLAGLPLITEKKHAKAEKKCTCEEDEKHCPVHGEKVKEAAEDMPEDDKKAEKKADKKDEKKDEDDLPKIVLKIAKAMCKEMGKTDDEACEEKMQDTLMKVYDAGHKDGMKEAEGGGDEEESDAAGLEEGWQDVKAAMKKVNTKRVGQGCKTPMGKKGKVKMEAMVEGADGKLQHIIVVEVDGTTSSYKAEGVKMVKGKFNPKSIGSLDILNAANSVVAKGGKEPAGKKPDGQMLPSHVGSTAMADADKKVKAMGGKEPAGKMPKTTGSYTGQ